MSEIPSLSPDIVNAAHLIGQTDPRIRRVVLFGSAARGTASPASDIDLCITVPDATKTGAANKIITAAYATLTQAGYLTGETPGGITIEAISDGEFLVGQRRGELYANINREGIILYEQTDS